jgi:hypothetical protein
MEPGGERLYKELVNAGVSSATYAPVIENNTVVQETLVIK